MREGMGLHLKLGNGKSCQQIFTRYIQDKRRPSNYLKLFEQQLELDMEQQTGSKQEKEFVKAVYCHPAYLTYMQSTS